MISYIENYILAKGIFLFIKILIFFGPLFLFTCRFFEKVSKRDPSLSENTNPKNTTATKTATSTSAIPNPTRQADGLK